MRKALLYIVGKGQFERCYLFGSIFRRVNSLAIGNIGCGIGKILLLYRYDISMKTVVVQAATPDDVSM